MREEPMWTPPPYGYKVDYDHNADKTGTRPQGNANLVATYRISYYDSYFTNPLTPPSTPKWTKEFTTKANASGDKYSFHVTTLDMFNNGYNNFGWPLGTYKVEEIKNPNGYHSELTPNLFQIYQKNSTTAAAKLVYGQNEAGNASLDLNDSTNGIVSSDITYRGDVQIFKYIENTTDVDLYPDHKQPAEGVKFYIINNNPEAVQRVDTKEWIPGTLTESDPMKRVVYTLVTDEQGFATTKYQLTEKGYIGIKNNLASAQLSPGSLPYGDYLVSEDPASTPAGYVPIEDDMFTIGANNKLVNKMYNNRTGTVVNIYKTDAGTNKTVRGETKFQLLDSNHKPMTFDVDYPSGARAGVFTTDINGRVELPDKLMMGTYYVTEIEAPEGYLWDGKEVSFEVDSKTAEEHGNYDVPYNVAFPDYPAMGRIQLVKKDSETLLPITEADATYDVFAAEDIITQDGTTRYKKDEKVDTITTVRGTATSKELYLGDYYLRETGAPEGYLLANGNAHVSLKYAGDRVAVVTAKTEQTDVAVRGYVSVSKLDADSGNVIGLAGATFDVFAAENIVGGDGYQRYAKGEKVDTLTTDKTGIGEGNVELPLGKYEVVETKAPYGYVLDPTPIEVELKYADQYTPFVTSMAISHDIASEGDFELVKLDRETGNTVWTPGTEIDVFAAEDIVKGDGSILHRRDDWVGSAVTDETGSGVTTSGLFPGKYYLQEKNAPYGYVLDAGRTYAVEMPWDGGQNKHYTSSASISDVPAKGVITFTKADVETGHTIPIEGIKAEVYANEDIVTGDGTVRYHKDDKVAELVTDVNGHARTGELYLGNYRVVETFAPYGYLLNETPVDVALVYENQNVAVTTSASQVLDENAKGIIDIVKIDKETGRVVPLAGATFEVRAKTNIVTGDGTVRATAGELVDSVTTDDMGKGSTKELYIGIYTVTETVAPHGYTLDTTPHDAVVAYKDQHTPVVFSTESVANVAQKGVISVTKVDKESELPILTSGAVFEVKAVEDIVTGDGTVRALAGDVVDTIETDDTGIAKTKALYLGKYEVHEIQAPMGYLLTDEVKNVGLVYGDQTEPLVYEMESVADQVVKGTITIHKEDSDFDEPLPNVEYEIRAAEDIGTGDGVVHYKKSEIVQTIVTDENGIATSDELYLGEYVVVETKQPNGYELDIKEYLVHLRYVDQTTPLVHEDITLYNTPSSISVKKVSTSDSELAVPGTKFVGWRTDDEMKKPGTFAVIAGYDVNIENASIDYLGAFTPEITMSVDKSFELKEADNNANTDDENQSYQMFSSYDELLEGDYVLHLTYTADGKQISEDIPFSVNEYDTSAIFAIGNDIVQSGDDANKFVRADENADADDVDVPEDIESGTDSNTSNGVDVQSDANEQEDASDDNTSENENDSESGSDENGNENVDSNDSDKNTSNGVKILRVPVALETGKFSYATTDEDGIATFKYVPQGKVAFAEYEPAEGYVSDRTPGYIDMGMNGRNGGVEANGNVSGASVDEDGNIELDMTFADDQMKLYISKKDITTSEELPGNTLSVYEYDGDKSKTSDEDVFDEDYGKLIETWVSTDEPHYMELLPQGTYILKEEQAVDGYTVAESILFKLNDTGVEQHVLMNNEHEAAVADEFIEMVETADFFPMALAGTVVVMMSAAGIIWYRRRNMLR